MKILFAMFVSLALASSLFAYTGSTSVYLPDSIIIRMPIQYSNVKSPLNIQGQCAVQWGMVTIVVSEPGTNKKIIRYVRCESEPGQYMGTFRLNKVDLSPFAAGPLAIEVRYALTRKIVTVKFGNLDSDGDGYLDKDDCALKDPTRSSIQALYRDQDGDKHGTLPSIQGCSGPVAPAGFALYPNDCNDSDASIHDCFSAEIKRSYCMENPLINFTYKNRLFGRDVTRWIPTQEALCSVGVSSDFRNEGSLPKQYFSFPFNLTGDSDQTPGNLFHEGISYQLWNDLNTASAKLQWYSIERQSFHEAVIPGSNYVSDIQTILPIEGILYLVRGDLRNRIDVFSFKEGVVSPVKTLHTPEFKSYSFASVIGETIYLSSTYEGLLYINTKTLESGQVRFPFNDLRYKPIEHAGNLYFHVSTSSDQDHEIWKMDAQRRFQKIFSMPEAGQYFEVRAMEGGHLLASLSDGSISRFIDLNLTTLQAKEIASFSNWMHFPLNSQQASKGEVYINVYHYATAFGYGDYNPAMRILKWSPLEERLSPEFEGYQLIQGVEPDGKFFIKHHQTGKIYRVR